LSVSVKNDSYFGLNWAISVNLRGTTNFSTTDLEKQRIKPYHLTRRLFCQSVVLTRKSTQAPSC